MSDRWICPHCNSATRGMRNDPNKCGHCKNPLVGFNEAQRALYTPRPAQVRREMRKVDQTGLAKDVAEQICADIREAAKEYPKPAKPKLKGVPQSDRHMLEIDVVDAHIGKLAWAPETGSNYDMAIAVERVRDAVTDILSQVRHYAIEKILLPWGNDFYHYDTLTGLTTAGTPQDRDSRYHKMFRTGKALASEVARRCAEVAPVDLLIIPGNHDEMASFHLGEVLAAEFTDHALVSVDNNLRPRKYRLYGNTLLGFCHGHAEPHTKLPLIMAQEVPEMWAQSEYREMHLGHLHTSKRTDARPVDGVNGVRVRILQSLTGTDSWHAKQGYVGEPGGCEAFVWNHARGLRSNVFSMLMPDKPCAA